MFNFVSSPGPGPYPGIVDLFGVGGGLLEYRASLLAGKGFAVLALAYYNYDDLPKSMEAMHIEYFEEAANYLLSHPEVRSPSDFTGLCQTSSCTSFHRASELMTASLYFTKSPSPLRFLGLLQVKG